MTKEYEIKTANRALKLGECHYCHLDFKAGDIIVSKGRKTFGIKGSVGRRKYYHAACWEGLFI